MPALIAEDLLLLLLDDEKGTAAASWVDVRVPLGAAVLADLALAGAVQPQDPGSRWKTTRIHVVGGATVDDEVLAAGLAIVGEKPRTAQDLAYRIGGGLRDRLADRLVDQGVLERREGKVLGLFPRTTWPERSAARESAVRDGLARVLLQDGEPDARQAVLAGILASLDRVPATLGLRGAEGRQAVKRAKAVSEGEWATQAVQDAVQAAITAVTTATVTSTVVAATS